MNGLKIAPGLVLPLEVAGEAIAVLAKRGAGKTNTGRVLVEEMFAAGVQVVVLDPVSAWWGLRSSASGAGKGLPIPVLGGAYGDVPLNATAGRLLADVVVDTEQSLVLDLSDFSKGDQRRFVVDFAEHLYRRKARARHLLHLVLEEADEFAPQKIRGGREGDARMLGAIEQLVRRGRSRGIGMTMITQRSAVLAKDVLEQTDVLIAMRATGPLDRKAISAWVDAKGVDYTGKTRDEDLLPPQVVPSLPTLANGEAWVWNPERDLLKRVKVRLATTYDAGATPKAGATRQAPKKLADIDLAVLGAEIAATAERAKENDPAELNKRIRQLKSELASAQLANASEVEVEVEKIVEVERVVEIEIAALTDAEWEQLRLLGSQVGELQDKLDQARAVFVVLTERLAAQAAERVARGLPTHTISDAKIDSWGPRSSGLGRIERVRPMLDATSSREPRQARSQTAGPTTVTVDGAKVGKGEMKVLQALAEFPEGRTHNELAFLTGYSAGASTIGTFISKLRAAGLVEQGQGPAGFRATEAGLAAAGGIRERPTGPALLDEWLRHPKMELGMRAVLNVLVDRYPDEPTHEELCDATGYSPTASTVGTFLSKLRKLGLVEGGRKLSPEFAEAIR